jgi:hypothetical protein
MRQDFWPWLRAPDRAWLSPDEEQLGFKHMGSDAMDVDGATAPKAAIHAAETAG